MQQSTPPPVPRRPGASADQPEPFTPAGVPRRRTAAGPQHDRHPFRLGLPLPLVLLLAALAVPGVVLHDLGAVADGGIVDSLLTTIPFAVWIIVAVARRTPSPLLTLVVVGGVYGLLEAVAHQALWGIASAAVAPYLDAVFGAAVDPVAAHIVVRLAVAFGSVVGGVVVGAVTGSVAWIIARAAHNPRR